MKRRPINVFLWREDQSQVSYAEKTCHRYFNGRNTYHRSSIEERPITSRPWTITECQSNLFYGEKTYQRYFMERRPITDFQRSSMTRRKDCSSLYKTYQRSLMGRIPVTDHLWREDIHRYKTYHRSVE